MWRPRFPKLPAGRTRKQEKRSRRTIENRVKARVRARVVARDGYCRVEGVGLDARAAIVVDDHPFPLAAHDAPTEAAVADETAIGVRAVNVPIALAVVPVMLRPVHRDTSRSKAGQRHSGRLTKP